MIFMCTVYCIFFFSVESIKTAWKHLRDGYIRCKSKRTKLTKSGSKSAKLPTSNFFNELKFLDDDYAEQEESASGGVENNETQQDTPKVPYRQGFSKKRKLSSIDESVDKQILDSLNQLSQKPQAEEKESANSLFCKSLVSDLDALSPEENMLARIKIQQVLFDIKFNKSN